ncbi:MAG TPA: glycosyltransferase, partial [Chloroflexi bacterium]|nr:glycosyltransferase [Chloroflexota bacterium]
MGRWLLPTAQQRWRFPPSEQQRGIIAAELDGPQPSAVVVGIPMASSITTEDLKAFTTAWQRAADDPVVRRAARLWQDRVARLTPEAPLRVLMLLSQRPGQTGSGVYLREVVGELQRAGHQVTVLAGAYHPIRGDEVGGLPDDHVHTLLFSEDEANPQGDVPFPISGMSLQMPYPSRPFRDLTEAQLNTYLRAFYGKIRRLALDFRPDLIHVNHLWLLNPIARLAAPWLPIVTTVHGTAYKLLLDAPRFGPLVRPGVQSVERVMPISPRTGEQAVQAFGVEASRVRVIGNGYNHRLFRLQSVDRAALFAHYRIRLPNPKARIVLCVSKFADYKGLPYLIRAAAHYHRAFPEPVATLIVGEGPPEARARLEALVHRLGLEGEVLLPGKARYEDVSRLMNVADLFVLPSVEEPFGLVLIEALASGLRVIATDRGGPPTFVPAELRAAGLAELVRPIAVDARGKPLPQDEEPFSRELAEAVLRMLHRPVTMAERRRIADAVAD